MINKIKILSPGSGCRRTNKIVKAITKFMEQNKIEFELEIVAKPDEFIKYKTWILPTVLINNKIVSRGYRPSNKIITDALKQ